MRRLLVLVPFIGLLLAGLVATPSHSFSAAGTPEPVFCSPEEIAAGEDAGFLPLGEEEGIVDLHRAGDPDAESLYIAVLTLPPGACIDYRERVGAVVLFVQSGRIVYSSRAADDPDVVITKGDSDGSGGDNITLTPGTTVTLRANEWITQDRAVWFSFRNSGSEDAVISAAVYAAAPWDDEQCDGGCRGKP